MTNEEFETRFKTFLDAFDKSFDDKANIDQLKDVVVQNSESESDIPINYEHVYQQQRTNNLVKLALLNFLDIDQKD